MNDTATSQLGAAAGKPILPGSNPSRRILVVDDDANIRQLNAKILRWSGYYTETAEDGAAAWDVMQSHHFDLLITDNDMPRMSGVELIGKLHAAHIIMPVIMATGAAPYAAFERFPWLQPAAVLIKPYTMVEVVLTVRRLLGDADTFAGSAAPPPIESQTGITVEWADHSREDIGISRLTDKLGPWACRITLKTNSRDHLQPRMELEVPAQVLRPAGQGSPGL